MEYLLELGRGEHLVRRAHLEHLALEEDHLVGELAQGGEVVGGQEDGQVVVGADLVQHVHQLLLPVDVHAGEGLVQHQDVGQGLQRQGQQHPLQLPAGQGPHPPIQQALPVNPAQALRHPGPQAPGGGQEHRVFGDGGGEEVEHAHRIPPVKDRGLGHVADQGPGLVPPGPLELDGAGVGDLPQDGAEQGALPRPVGADEGHDLPAVEVEGDVAQHLLVAEVHPQVGHPQAAGPGAAGAGGSVSVYAHPNASTMVSMFPCMASM